MRRLFLFATLPGLLALPLLVLLPDLEDENAQTGVRPPAVAGPAGDAGRRWLHWDGVSTMRLTGACAADLCAPDLRTENGRFFLPSTGSAGRVLVEWTPSSAQFDELEVSVGPVTMRGRSPLLFDVPSHGAGDVVLRAKPVVPTIGTPSQTLRWHAEFLVDPVPHDTRQAGRTTVPPGALDTYTDELFVPWTAQGALVATWDEDLALRVGVRDTTFAAEGRSPLTLHLTGLGPGEWPLTLARADTGDLHAGVSIDWEAWLAPRDEAP